MSVPAYVFPAALRALPRGRSAVVEASAGTGKTFLLEHLVADRVLRGDARLEEILVVTFTEKATLELVRASARSSRACSRTTSRCPPAPTATPPGSSMTRPARASSRRSGHSTAPRSRRSTVFASAS